MIEPGPPGPPDSVTVEEVTDSTAQLAWSRGRDNGSPIANYFIQTRTPFTVGWQRVNTGGRALRRDPTPPTTTRGNLLVAGGGGGRSERRVSRGMEGGWGLTAVELRGWGGGCVIASLT